MERRYLVAALAIIATFTGFSRGFHSLQRMSFDHSEHSQAMAVAKCWASSAAQTVAKVRAHLHRGYPPEQAQLLAEMNVPLTDMQVTIDEQMARQDASVARCARARAMQEAERAQRQAMLEAERARRDAMRMRENFVHAYAHAYPVPSAVAVSFPPDFERRIQEQVTAATVRFAANQAKYQMAAEKFAEVEIPSVDVDTQVSPVVIPNVHCKVKVSRHTAR